MWKIAGPVLTFVFFVLSIILSPMAAAAECRAASELLLERPVTIRSAYAAFSDRKARLVGLSIWQGLLSFWPFIPLVIVAAALTPLLGKWSSSSWSTVMIIALMIPCLPLYARYLLAFPSTAITDSDISNSITRSVDLGRGYRWKVLWAFVLPTGVGAVIAGGGVALIEWLGLSSHLAVRYPFILSAVSAIWTFAASLLYEPLASIALTLTYYDLCVRKEGFDVVQLIERAELEPGSPEAEPA
jgi:hypothetical protein